MNRKALCTTTNYLLNEIIIEFALQYYGDDNDKTYVPDIYLIDKDEDWIRYNFVVNDDYWNVDQAFTALWYDIPANMLFKWLSMSIEASLKDIPCISLKNFYLINRKENDWRKKKACKDRREKEKSDCRTYSNCWAECVSSGACLSRCTSECSERGSIKCANANDTNDATAMRYDENDARENG